MKLCFLTLVLSVVVLPLCFAMKEENTLELTQNPYDLDSESLQIEEGEPSIIEVPSYLLYCEAVDNFTPLHEVLYAGYKENLPEEECIERLKVYLIAGVDVNAQDSLGCTPLHWAARHGKLEIVKLLLQADADLTLQDSLGDTVLHLAIGQGHVELALFLIGRGVDVNVKNRSGSVSLHYATFNSSLVEALLKAGAEVNAHDIFGFTPLHEAARSGHVKSVKLLLEAGAFVDSQDNNGHTPLSTVLNKRSSNSAQVEQLLVQADASLTIDTNRDDYLSYYAYYGSEEHGY